MCPWVLLGTLLLALAAWAAGLTGRVVGLADGDTLTLLTPERRQVRIRLGEKRFPHSPRGYWGPRNPGRGGGPGGRLAGNGAPAASLCEQGWVGALMRRLAILGLLVVAGCAVPEPYGESSEPFLGPSSPSTMRQLSGRAEELDTFKPEHGDIWATEPSSKRPPTSSRTLRATTPRRELPLALPPLRHADGNF